MPCESDSDPVSVSSRGDECDTDPDTGSERGRGCAMGCVGACDPCGICPSLSCWPPEQR